MLISFIFLGIVGLLIIACLRATGRKAGRTVTGFVAAPAIASAAALVVSFAWDHEILTALIIASFTGTLGYVAAVVLGIPVYWLLRWQRLTSVWITTLAGALIAMVAGYSMWGIELGYDVGGLFAITGALGIVSGLAFWVIARPDLQHKS